MSGDNHFAGPYLDRRAEERLAADWFEQARHDPAALFLAMREGAALVRNAPEEGPRLALLGADDPRIAAALAPERAVLLGWYEERRVLLVDLPEEAARTVEGEAFAELRPLAAELPPGEAGLAAYARALHLWHGNHRFCGRCGAPTAPERAGHARRCAACGQVGFPRIDPAVIVLAHDGERALLGRQASWPPGRYSTIAGFVEPGESLEDAVRRELREEVGVGVLHIAYHSSQPWPFPSSLMLGFIARVEHATPVLNDGELEDARWFTREELLSGEVRLPPPHAISRRLINEWIDANADAR
ncbi:MAG: NAD(+) diphosphatase [Pseudomonadota bacterium]